jgi:DNA polymerase-3 subunit alpha
MAAEAKNFFEMARKHGAPLKKVEELWGLIEPFARYGFPKAHAVAYALVAYKTAFLKAHYPVDFLAATLSAEIGSTDGIVKVIGDCVEMGIPVLPPDINESRQKFAAVGPAIRFGLAAVKGVGDAAAEAILRERHRGLPLLHGLRRPAGFTRQQAHARCVDCAWAFDSLNRATLRRRSGSSPARPGRTKKRDRR